MSEAIPQRTPRRGRSRAAPRRRRPPEARRRPFAAATSRPSFAALRPLLCSWPSLPSGFAFPQRAVELAKGGTRAALRRRRSAGQRPAAARSARLGAGRRIPRRAAGGSLGRHSHAAFRPQGSPACGQQRALAGALSAIREQPPSLSLPPRHRTQVKLGRRHGRGEAVPFHSDGRRAARERLPGARFPLRLLPAPAPSAPLPPAALLSRRAPAPEWL